MSDTPDTSLELASTRVVYTPPTEDLGDMFADPAAFAHWQRVAAMFARSSLVPPHLRGPEHLPDIMIGLSIAKRHGLNQLQVLQSLYTVSDRAGWLTTFLTALAQHAGWDLDYEVTQLEPATIKYGRYAKKEGKTYPEEIANLGVRCIMRKGGLTKVGQQVTTGMAVRSRWANNEQYVMDTEGMLTNRAATKAIRRHAPGILLGLSTVDEIQDERDTAEYIPPPTSTTTSTPTPGPRPTKGPAAVMDALVSSAPSSPTPTTPQVHVPDSPAAAGGASIGEGADHERSKLPPKNAVVEGDLIRQALASRMPGDRVGFEIACRAHREKLGATRKLSDERTWEAVKFGELKGWWKVEGDLGNRDLIYLVMSGGHEPAKPPPEPKSAVDEVVDQATMERRALAVEAGRLTRKQLIEALADQEDALEKLDTPGEVLDNMARNAGLPVDSHGAGAQTDGAPDEALVRYLVELRMYRRAVEAIDREHKS
jgi:hypothetical protein